MYWIRKLFSNGEIHGKALGEVFVVSVFSIVFVSLPAWRALGANTPVDSIRFFSTGQLLALSYALYGTVFWLAFVRWDRPRHDVRIVLGFLGTLLMIPIIPYLSYDPNFESIVAPGAFRISVWVYFIFVLIVYLLLFYSDIEPPSPEKTLKEETSKLKSQYRKRSGAQDSN